MNKLPLRLLSIAFTIIFIFSFSGCSFTNNLFAPDNYKNGYKVNNDFPFDTIPLYNKVIIFEYEEDDGTFSLKAGSVDELDDIADFYMDFFEDEEISLEVEKDRRNEYIAEGYSGKYEFEIVAEKPFGKWEEKLYETVININVSLLNIPNKDELHEYINLAKEDLNILSDILVEDELLDEAELTEELCIQIEGFKETISERLLQIKKRDVPKHPEFEIFQTNHIALFELSLEIFKEYNEITEYGNDLLDLISTLETTNTNDVTELYNQMNQMYTEAISQLEEIRAPSFLSNMHNNMIEVFKQTNDAVLYTLVALDLSDPVRLDAGAYMMDIAVRDMDKIVDKIDLDSTDRQKKIDADTLFVKDIMYGFNEWLDKIIIEINNDDDAISQLPKDLYISDQVTKISCNYVVPDVIIPANYRSLENIAFLQCWTNKGLANAKISVEIPGLTQKYEQKIELTRAETELSILPPLLDDATDNLNSSREAQIVISVEDLNSGELIVQDSIDIKIYSRFDMQWQNQDGILYLENILAWITPEAPEIKQLLRYSADSADYLTGNVLDSIVGYQYVSDWNEITTTYAQICSMMHAMANTMEVKYVATPFSTTATHLQRVATPAEVLNNSSGVCVETAVTIASAIQATGMHPVLIILPGHVQVAVETWRNSGEYLLVETTALAESTEENFDEVILYLTPDEWSEYISQDGYTVIDCDFSEHLGIRSID